MKERINLTPTFRLFAAITATLVAFSTAASKAGEAETASAHALVDEIIAKPGLFRQVCISIGSPYDFPAYGVHLRGFHLITAENFKRLRKDRSAVVADLIARIETVRGAPNDKWQWDSKIQHVLVMLIDLNATEALPELLLFETKIHTDGKMKEERPEQFTIAPNKQTIHRDVLGVIAAILRQERYQPLLDSDIEKQYRQALEKESQSSNLKGIRKVEDLTASQRSIYSFDPLVNLPYRSETTVQIPYTDSLRNQVVQMIETYLKTVPPGQRKGAAGMITHPVNR